MTQFRRSLCSVIGAVFLTLPVVASAATLKIIDVNSAAEEVVHGVDNVSYSGTVGGVVIDDISGDVTRTAGKYALDLSSVQTSGIGQLKIIFVADGFRNLESPRTSLFSQTTIVDPAFHATVQNFIKINGSWTKVGSLHAFLAADGNGQSASSSEEVLTGSGDYQLKTVLRLISSTDESSHINTTLSAEPAIVLIAEPAIVPLPAAGFLLIGGLGALAGLRRRRRRN